MDKYEKGDIIIIDGEEREVIYWSKNLIISRPV